MSPPPPNPCGKCWGTAEPVPSSGQPAWRRFNGPATIEIRSDRRRAPACVSASGRAPLNGAAFVAAPFDPMFLAEVLGNSDLQRQVEPGLHKLISSHLRDRQRHARLRGGRTLRDHGRDAFAAAVPRTPPRADRGRAEAARLIPAATGAPGQTRRKQEPGGTMAPWRSAPPRAGRAPGEERGGHCRARFQSSSREQIVTATAPRATAMNTRRRVPGAGCPDTAQAAGPWIVSPPEAARSPTAARCLGCPGRRQGLVDRLFVRESIDRVPPRIRDRPVGIERVDAGGCDIGLAGRNNSPQTSGQVKEVRDGEVGPGRLGEVVGPRAFPRKDVYGPSVVFRAPVPRPSPLS